MMLGATEIVGEPAPTIAAETMAAPAEPHCSHTTAASALAAAVQLSPAQQEKFVSFRAQHLEEIRESFVDMKSLSELFGELDKQRHGLPNFRRVASVIQERFISTLTPVQHARLVLWLNKYVLRTAVLCGGVRRGPSVMLSGTAASFGAWLPASSDRGVHGEVLYSERQ